MRYARTAHCARAGRRQPTALIIPQLLILRDHQARCLRQQLTLLNQQLAQHTQHCHTCLQTWQQISAERAQHSLTILPVNNLRIQSFKTECDLHFIRERQSYQYYLDALEVCKVAQQAITQQQHVINDNSRSQEKLRAVLEVL
ncbi:MAG: hypothetical protein ACRC9O_01320 [Plesiomonas sp.]|uniref:hypothetical protein n=1 Tax=Plesiomonas sp. TaxID=2486279 RepID=UPI003F3A01C8